MVICTMFCTNTAKADTDLPWDESEVVETSTCIVNGVERNLIILKRVTVIFKIGEFRSSFYVGFNNVSAKFDQYGTIWVMDSRDDAIRWWNYDLSPTELDFYAINKPTAENPDAFVDDVESFILDENNKFIVGYKTFSGQTYPILTLDEMKEILKDSSSTPTPTPTPTPSNIPTPTPTIPAATPNVPTPSAPTVSPVATPPTTNTPAVTPKTTVAPKVSVKKKAGYNCLSLGKYKLRVNLLGKESKVQTCLHKKGKLYTLSWKKSVLLKEG